eukprot:COSAG05_NODE_2962_length_2460_cov_1.737399_4_plen_123_part_00
MAAYGDCEEIHHGDFDMHSKVEPFKRALADVGREYLVTGRRMDQGEKRTDIDIYEPGESPSLLSPQSSSCPSGSPSPHSPTSALHLPYSARTPTTQTLSRRYVGAAGTISCCCVICSNLMCG